MLPNGERRRMQVQWPGLILETWGSRVSHSQHAISIEPSHETLSRSSYAVCYCMMGRVGCNASCTYRSGMMYDTKLPYIFTAGASITNDLKWP